MTLQLNAFPSDSESLSFLGIVIFNSHPRADHRVFTGVWWVVFYRGSTAGSECSGSSCPGHCVPLSHLAAASSAPLRGAEQCENTHPPAEYVRQISLLSRW